MGIVRVMEKGDHVKGAIVRKMKKKQTSVSLPSVAIASLRDGCSISWVVALGGFTVEVAGSMGLLRLGERRSVEWEEGEGGLSAAGDWENCVMVGTTGLASSSSSAAANCPVSDDGDSWLEDLVFLVVAFAMMKNGYV